MIFIIFFFQGKSALWSYIIAYHEWEKRINNNNNKESSRRSSSIGFENNNINNNISLSTHGNYFNLNRKFFQNIEF